MGQHGQYRALVNRGLAIGLIGAVLSTPAWSSCRQALVLGLDVSASVDLVDYRLQVEGLVAALNAQTVRALILTQPEAPVHLAVFEWSGPPNPPRLIVPLTPVTDAPTLNGIIDRIRSANGRAVAGSTAIGSAMISALELLRGTDDCWQRTIDLSGDGQSNVGPPPESVDIPADITINGLAIGGMTRPGDERLMDIKELSTYYRVNVIRGPNAFVETALGFADFEAAMTRKLIRELQGLPLGFDIHGSGPIRLAASDQ
jgi:hypothetical protein